MTAETNSNPCVKQERKIVHSSPASAPVYGLGFIGAAVYYVQFADTFWVGVLGFLKAIVWPAMLVYELLKYLNM
jgi:hypothetical protein